MQYHTRYQVYNTKHVIYLVPATPYVCTWYNIIVCPVYAWYMFYTCSYWYNFSVRTVLDEVAYRGGVCIEVGA